MVEIEVHVTGLGEVRNEVPAPDDTTVAHCSFCDRDVDAVASVTPAGTGIFACKDCLRIRLEAMTVGAYLLKPKKALPWGKLTS